MGTQVLRVLEPADLAGDIASVGVTAFATGGASNNSAGSVVEAKTDTDPGHGICSQNPTPCGCLRVYVHASPKAPPGQRLTVCVINLGSTSQDVRRFSKQPPVAFICIASSSCHQHFESLLTCGTCEIFHCGMVRTVAGHSGAHRGKQQHGS
jgi:hypothetical protein